MPSSIGRPEINLVSCETYHFTYVCSETKIIYSLQSKRYALDEIIYILKTKNLPLYSVFIRLWSHNSLKQNHTRCQTELETY